MEKRAKMKLDHECWKVFKVKNIELPYHRMAGVYKIGWMYIGASKHIQARLKSHYSALKNQYHTNKELQFFFNVSRDLGIEIPIYILDDNPNNEYMWKKYYGIYSSGYGKYGETYYHQMSVEGVNE